MLKKVVILGPESTGKSTLCSQLAEHFKTRWVKEYAREYLLTNGTAYTFENLLDIARGQLGLEDAALAEQTIQHSPHPETPAQTPGNNGILFIDTNMYVMKVWCEFVFGNCHHFILNQLVERTYDLYLLCDIDLPWVTDELREYPDLFTRIKLYFHYKDILVNQHVPWVNISGDYEQRLQKAIEAVNKMTLGDVNGV